jgi:hypothetical protein
MRCTGRNGAHSARSHRIHRAKFRFSLTVRHWLAENQFQIERQLTVSHFRIDDSQHCLDWLEVWMHWHSAPATGGSLPSVFVKAYTGSPDQAMAGRHILPFMGWTGVFRCPVCGNEFERGNGCPCLPSCAAAGRTRMDLRLPVIERRTRSFLQRKNRIGRVRRVRSDSRKA